MQKDSSRPETGRVHTPEGMQAFAKNSLWRPVVSLCVYMASPRGGLQFSSRHQPPRHGRGVLGRGGSEILLPSAVHLEERRTVSQQSVSRASRQADRNTQFGFFQWQTRLQAVGKAGRSNANAAGDRPGGGRFDSWSANRQRRRLTCQLCPICTSFKPFLAQTFLTPPPPPRTQKKVISNFRG